MTLLTITQDAMTLCGVTEGTITTAYGSSDTTVAQFVALAQVEGDELSRFADWRRLKTAGTITGDGTTTLWPLPTGFDRLMNGSIFWSASSPGSALYGPVSDSDLVAMKAMDTEPPQPVWRLVGTNIEIWPALDAGEVVSYEYRTEQWILSNDLATARSRWAADTDTAIVPERILTLGVVWRWKQSKGLEYSEAFRTYQIERARQAASDAGKGIIRQRETFAGDVAKMGRLAYYRVTG